MSPAIPWTSLPRALDLAYSPWHDGLIALFAMDPRGSPSSKQVEAVGTGFFLACKGGVAIITADHVIKDLVSDDVGGLAGLVKGCPFPLTRRWVRLPDLDLCACWFALSELEAYGVEPVLPVPFMSDRSNKRSLGVYVAMGFPNTWNMRNRRRSEGGESLMLFCDRSAPSPPSRYGPRAGEFALDFDRDQCVRGIANPRHGGIPALQGMSGGPVFETFVGQNDGSDRLMEFSFELAGVVLRRDPKDSRIVCASRSRLFALGLHNSAHL